MLNPAAPGPALPSRPPPNTLHELQALPLADWQAVLTGPPQQAARWVGAAAQVGHGQPRQPAQALHWFLRAAQQGHAKAFAKLGRCHEDGLVVAQDADIALRCYQRGAECGDFRGQFCYAGMLAARGRQAEALHWLRQVPSTATPRFLKEAGALLQRSPNADFQAVGARMLAQANAADAPEPLPEPV